ncbi:MAG: autotransporter outer membrane beta-barrel domain-containing protein, partial [Acetobacteraceae bacterium]
SNPGAFLAGARLRGGYEFAFDHWYIRPYADLDLLYTNLLGFRESGPAGYALDVHSSSKVSVGFSPMVEFGGRYAINSKTTLRPFLALGVSFLPDNTRSIEANLAGALSQDGTFQSFLRAPDVLGNLELGVQLYRAGGFEVEARYDVHAAGSFLSQGGNLRLAYHF